MASARFAEDRSTPESHNTMTAISEALSDEPKTQFTERGFAFVEFTDAYGTECNIQKSSLATDDAIWIGAKEIGLKQFTPYQGGWKDVPTPSDPNGTSYIANNRMHLTRDQVAELLPILAHFVETGDVSVPDKSLRSGNGGEVVRISGATFDIMEKMAETHPVLKGGYARSTGGVDFDLVVAVFANALRQSEQFARDLESSILESQSLADFQSVKKTVEAIRALDIKP